MENNILQKIHNYNYAPGIATYGVDGKTGNPGLNGNNIFYTNIDITNTDGLKKIAACIAKPCLPLTNNDEIIQRPYQNGDYFLSNAGEIYELINIDALLKNANNLQKYTDYFDIVAKIKYEADSQYIEITGNDRAVINTKYAGFDIISKNLDIKDTSINTDSAVNIISNNINADGHIVLLNFITLGNLGTNNADLILYYDTIDNAFHIDSENALVINSDVKLKEATSEPVDIDNYSSVLTSKDTITYFKNLCDSITYTINEIIVDPSTNESKITLTITINNENVYQRIKVIKNSIYIKIYTQNANYLYRLADTRDGESTFEIDLNNISKATDVLIVTLLYNTEIILKNII